MKIQKFTATFLAVVLVTGAITFGTSMLIDDAFASGDKRDKKHDRYDDRDHKKKDRHYDDYERDYDKKDRHYDDYERDYDKKDRHYDDYESDYKYKDYDNYGDYDPNGRDGGYGGYYD